MDDNTALILLRHLVENSQVDGTVDLTDAEARAAEVDALEGRDWLLAYEWAAHGWVPDSLVVSDPFFAAMKAAGVYFFEPGPPPSTGDSQGQPVTPHRPSGAKDPMGTADDDGDTPTADGDVDSDDLSDSDDFEP